MKPLDPLEVLEIDKAIKLLLDNKISVEHYTTVSPVVTLSAPILLQMFDKYELIKLTQKYMYKMIARKDGIEYHAYVAEWEFEQYGIKLEAKNEAV